MAAPLATVLVLGVAPISSALAYGVASPSRPVMPAQRGPFDGCRPGWPPRRARRQRERPRRYGEGSDPARPRPRRSVLSRRGRFGAATAHGEASVQDDPALGSVLARPGPRRIEGADAVGWHSPRLSGRCRCDRSRLIWRNDGANLRSRSHPAAKPHAVDARHNGRRWLYRLWRVSALSRLCQTCPRFRPIAAPPRGRDGRSGGCR